MRLLSLTLETFRSYRKLDLSFEHDQNLFVFLGENATGKTNVLEAISILSLLKSSRKIGDTDLITWNKTHYRIRGLCRSDRGEERTLEVVLQIEPRKTRGAFINDVRTPSAHYIGSLPIITFMPDDLLLWSGTPSNRRRMINILLCQVSPAYLQALSEYEKAIRQRNTLLKHIREENQKITTLHIWDEKLATLGAIITLDRLQLFETLQETILRELTALGEKPHDAQFIYIRKSTGMSESDIREELLAELKHYHERDVLTCTTTTGPHRDDWTLSMNGHDISTSASRGQQRAALLALLLLQASFLELRKGEKPILLLDDIFSEFDANHRKAVLKNLSNHQVMMTAVEMDTELKKKTQVLACPLV